MSKRILWVGWIGTVVVALVLGAMAFVWLPRTTIALNQARGQRVALERQHKDIEGQIKSDIDGYVKIFRRFPWLMEGAGGTAFLARLSDVAAGQALKIVGVGALERKKSGGVERVGRKVQLVGSFLDVVGLVENVESNRGIMEGVKIGKLDQKGATKLAEPLEAQFGLVTVELSPEVRKRMQAVLAGSPEPAKPKGDDKSLVLPAPKPARPAKLAALRDPFRETITVAARRMPAVPGQAAGAAPEDLLFPDLKLSGIISFPGRRVAILNNQMVQQGQRVEGILVERISDTQVVLRSGSQTKRLEVPEFRAPKAGK